MTPKDLVTAYRTKTKNIYVKFNSQIIRDKLYNSRIQLQKENIDTTKLGYPDKKSIYLNEVLDEKQNDLFYQARLKRKAAEYRYIWTYHGNIYMTKDNEGDILKIESPEELKSL